MRIKLAAKQEWRVDENEAIKIQRRVLKLVDGYLAKQQQGTLISNGRGMMTFAELRQHIKGALSLKIV